MTSDNPTGRVLTVPDSTPPATRPRVAVVVSPRLFREALCRALVAGGVEVVDAAAPLVDLVLSEDEVVDITRLEEVFARIDAWLEVG